MFYAQLRLLMCVMPKTCTNKMVVSNFSKCLITSYKNSSKSLRVINILCTFAEEISYRGCVDSIGILIK